MRLELEQKMLEIEQQLREIEVEEKRQNEMKRRLEMEKENSKARVILSYGSDSGRLNFPYRTAE